MTSPAEPPRPAAQRPPLTVLVANRGEIAVRILRTARRLGHRTHAVYTAQDAAALHVRLADGATSLPGTGPAGYLDVPALVDAARGCGADVLHPGYGFASENPALAQACAAAGVAFAGPDADVLALAGDKLAARRRAAELGLPVLPGSPQLVDAAGAAEFLDELRRSNGEDAAVVLKAAAGGGGRGIRVVRPGDDITALHARAASEARAAFGDGGLFVEALLSSARHIEVQIIGDGSGRAVALGDRDCSVQRRHQKLLEIAPAPELEPALRTRLAEEAVELASALRYRGVGTVEFLVPLPGGTTDGAARADHFFLEMNPRLQVEHTVTEAVSGVDLVAVGLRLAGGATLDELDVVGRQGAGAAIQVRLCTETLTADGSIRPASGQLTGLHLPGGPGLRVDTAAYAGWEVSPAFDSLLAKVVADADDLPAALRLLRSALREVRVDGVATNLGLLTALLDSDAYVPGSVGIDFVDSHRADLVAAAARESATEPAVPGPRASSSGPDAARPAAEQAGPETDPAAVRSPLQGTVVEVSVAVGDDVAAGTQLVVLEAMKMEQVVQAPHAGTVQAVSVTMGDAVADGAVLLQLAPGAAAESATAAATVVDLAHVRDDLAALQARRAMLADEARPDAVAKRHAAGHRTARENIADLVEPDSLVEYGGLTFAAQRNRRSVEDLMARTPADGLIGGLAEVNRGRFVESAGRDPSRCAVLSYDYTVLAGTQGTMGHRKSDRLFDVIERLRLPTVFFAEGGGGRPGDTDYPIVSALDVPTFAAWGRLSGLVPRIGVVGGRCFAGNAAIFGCSDVTIATADSSIGMGGPAMIEGGGLGTVGRTRWGRRRCSTRTASSTSSSTTTRQRSRRPGRRCPTSRDVPRRGTAPTSGCCGRWCRRTGCGSTKCAT